LAENSNALFVAAAAEARNYAIGRSKRDRRGWARIMDGHLPSEGAIDATHHHLIGGISG
jgi:hypothetical protein